MFSFVNELNYTFLKKGKKKKTTQILQEILMWNNDSTYVGLDQKEIKQ